MAALLQFPEADLAYLGRWTPTAASGYVRTATEVVMKVQSAVARRLRRDFAVQPVDAMVGEQAAYLEMRKELLRRKFGEQVIEEQLDALRAWTEQLAAPGAEVPAGLVPVEELPDAVLGVEAPAEEEPALGEPKPSELWSAAPPTPPAEPSSAGDAPPPFAGPGGPKRTAGVRLCGLVVEVGLAATTPDRGLYTPSGRALPPVRVVGR